MYNEDDDKSLETFLRIENERRDKERGQREFDDLFRDFMDDNANTNEPKKEDIKHGSNIPKQKQESQDSIPHVKIWNDVHFDHLTVSDFKRLKDGIRGNISPKKLSGTFEFFAFLNNSFIEKHAEVCRLKLLEMEQLCKGKRNPRSEIIRKLSEMGVCVPISRGKKIRLKYYLGIAAGAYFYIEKDKFKTIEKKDQAKLNLSNAQVIRQIKFCIGDNALGFTCADSPPKEFLINMLYSIDPENELFGGENVRIFAPSFVKNKDPEGEFEVPNSFKNIIRITKSFGHTIGTLKTLESRSRYEKNLGALENNIQTMIRISDNICKQVQKVHGFEFTENFIHALEQINKLGE